MLFPHPQLVFGLSSNTLNQNDSNIVPPYVIEEAMDREWSLLRLTLVFA
jgi:hypothetical protein